MIEVAGMVHYYPKVLHLYIAYRNANSGALICYFDRFHFHLTLLVNFIRISCCSFTFLLHSVYVYS
jgi:hypothetical protein